MQNKIIIRALVCGALAMNLSACLGVVAVGAGVGTSSAQDSRTLGSQIDDETIETRAMSRLREREDIATQSHVEVVSYNGIVLVLGQTPNVGYQRDIGTIVSGVPSVRKVYNEVQVAAPRSMWTGLGDTGLTTKVKTSLLTESNFPSGRVKVVTEQSVVYLFGILTAEQAQTATRLASEVSGVEKVVQLFDIIQR